MSISNSLLESLLYENEGTAHDFKSEQYRFQATSDDEKSELLKDVLAFANSWRRSDAYILIGVEEVKGGRAIVRGVSSHLDDASLQQFVNSKTNKPVALSCFSHQCDGKEIGIIKIDMQPRPVFLNRDYGKLKKNTVYVRRGSSTDEADPHEVSEMGKHQALPANQEPVLEVEFADTLNRKKLGLTLQVESIDLLLPDPESIEDYGTLWSMPMPQPNAGLTGVSRNQAQIVSIGIPDPGSNKDYYRELAKYKRDHLAVNPVNFVATNISGVLAEGVCMEVVIEDSNAEVVLFDERSLPAEPSESRLVLPSPRPVYSDVRIMRSGLKWIVKVNFGRVQPKNNNWTSGAVFIGSRKEMEIKMAGQVFADNLSNPKPVEFVVRTHCVQQQLDMEKLLVL